MSLQFLVVGQSKMENQRMNTIHSAVPETDVKMISICPLESWQLSLLVIQAFSVFWFQTVKPSSSQVFSQKRKWQTKACKVTCAAFKQKGFNLGYVAFQMCLNLSLIRKNTSDILTICLRKRHQYTVVVRQFTFTHQLHKCHGDFGP